jgi:hypothetical protein
MSTTVLEDTGKAAAAAAVIVEQIHLLEKAALVGNLDVESRIDIAWELSDALEVLNSFRIRLRG